MKTYQGNVISAKSQKTVTVEVKVPKNFVMYNKKIWTKSNYLVDNQIEAKMGDKVKFVETRPISKNKRWKIVEIIGGKAPQVISKKEAVPPKKMVKKTERKVKR